MSLIQTKELRNQRDEICALLVKNGEKPDSVAKKLGISHMTVKRACWKFKVEYDNRRREIEMTEKDLEISAKAATATIYRYLLNAGYIQDLAESIQTAMSHRIAQAFRPHLAKLDSDSRIKMLQERVVELEILLKGSETENGVNLPNVGTGNADVKTKEVTNNITSSSTISNNTGVKAN